MRLRLAVLVAALALAVSACTPGGPTPGGAPASVISANVLHNTRLTAGSCGTPQATPPSSISNWVGSATGLVRGKLLGFSRGPTAPDNIPLQLDIQVGTVHGDVVASPGDVLHGLIIIWNQDNSDQAWKDWGEPLTFERFDDQIEVILPSIGQIGPYIAGRLCYPIMFGTTAEGAFLGGTNWGTLDGVESAAAAVIASH